LATLTERGTRQTHGARSLLKAVIGSAKWGLFPLKLLPAAQRADAVDILLGKPVVVDTPHGEIRFLNHGRRSYWRARTIMTKEPDSMSWIDAMQPGSVFWDIGANVGVLTLYAAMRGDIEVWAFEPAAVNYYNLIANCELNGLEKRVRCLQLGFGETSEILDLNVSQLKPAESFSFRQSTKPWKVFSSAQAVQVCSIDDFIAQYGAPRPNYIKIDVPGLTHEIFAGARRMLAQPALKEIQVEASEHGSGRRIAELLAPFGFTIVKRGMRYGGTFQRDLIFGRNASDAYEEPLATTGSRER
jgi:FkbM family methyltransferase